MDKLAKESGFHGVLEEYPDVAVDYFAGNSLDCSVFFLSHCHTDHMVGLNTEHFKGKLKSSSDIKLFSSKCTMELLTADYNYGFLKQHMVTLDVHETCTITLPGNKDSAEVKSFLVTLLPAGHCPGSVMFLFEGYGGTVLHTGDFRLTVDDLGAMKALHIDDKLKTINKLYIDTTFCCSKVLTLPKRTQSRDLLFSLLDPWLADQTDKTVFIELPAKYGCEYLFVELHNRYKMKVHVPSSKIWRYKAIPEIMNAVTVDSQETRIHACNTVWSQMNGGEKCYWNCRSDYIQIKCSTLWFMFNSDLKQSNDFGGFICQVKGYPRKYRLCYSMHSSLKEILEFVQFLNPKAVHPLVIPPSSTIERVREILKLPPGSSESSLSLEFGDFGELKNHMLKSSVGSSLDSDLIFETDSLPDSPPPMKTRRVNGNTRMPSPRTPKLTESKTDCSTPEWNFAISPSSEHVSSSQEEEKEGSAVGAIRVSVTDSDTASNLDVTKNESTDNCQLSVRCRSNLDRDAFRFNIPLQDDLKLSSRDSQSAFTSESIPSKTGESCSPISEVDSKMTSLKGGVCNVLQDGGMNGGDHNKIGANDVHDQNDRTNLKASTSFGGNNFMQFDSAISGQIPSKVEPVPITRCQNESLPVTTAIANDENDIICSTRHSSVDCGSLQSVDSQKSVDSDIIFVETLINVPLRSGVADSVATPCRENVKLRLGGCGDRSNRNSNVVSGMEVPVIDLTCELGVSDVQRDSSVTELDWDSTPELYSI